MSIQKPSVFPLWAQLDVVNPTSGQNNVTTPPLELQQYGWAFESQPPRNWFNWLGRYTSNWLQWLNQQESQSRVTSDNTGATPIVEVVNGGMALISVIDIVTPANCYQGITYIPPAYAGGTSFTTTTRSEV